MAAKFTAFLTDAETRRMVRELDAGAEIRRGSVRNAAVACQTEESADIVLVDLDGEQNPLAHMATLLRVCRPQSVILATGSENNVALANDLYRGGVFLYLPKPLDGADLSRGMREVETAHDEELRPEIQTSRLVMVLGKGMGVNTVTAVLARLAAERGRYVSCVDLDPAFGTLALALDTQPQRGLDQALQNWDGPVAAERLQTRVSDRINLVAHSLDRVGRASAEDGLVPLIEALADHAHVILACGATLAHVDVLRAMTTHHVVVFEPTPAGVSIAARWLRVLEGASSLLVMNHARPLARLLSQEQLRENLGDRVANVEIPYLKSMARAMELGEPDKGITRRERALFERILNPLVGLGSAEAEE